MVKNLSHTVAHFMLIALVLFYVDSKKAEANEIVIAASTFNCFETHMNNLNIIWRDELRKASNKYSVYEEAIKMSKSNINDLFRDISWFGMKATDAGALNVGMSAAGINAMANLTNGLLKLHPGAKAAKLAQPWKSRLLYLIEKGGSAQSSGMKGMFQDVGNDIILSGLKEKYNPIVESAKTINNLIRDVKKLSNMPAEQNRLKKTVARNLDRLSGQLNSYKEALKGPGRTLREYQKVVAAVRKYCGEEKDVIADLIVDSEPEAPPRTERSFGENLAALGKKYNKGASKNWKKTSDIKYSSDTQKRALISFNKALKTRDEQAMKQAVEAAKSAVVAWNQFKAANQRSVSGNDNRCRQTMDQIQDFKSKDSQLNMSFSGHREYRERITKPGIQGNQRWYDANCR